jgi:RNA-directed DNA polymerase
MSGHSAHENREIPGIPVYRMPAGRTDGEGNSPTAIMNVSGKSDMGVVPMKRSNKPAPLVGAEMVEGRSVTKGNSTQPTVTGTQSPGQALSGLGRVREVAGRNKELRFTSLMHHLTPGILEEAYWALKRQAAPGVDGMTWDSYGEQLRDRLQDLHERIHSGRYRAQPSKRAWIPKPDGRQRPLGIAALEDKVVQMATVWVLNAIFEEDFAGFSYGFRPQRGQHHALDALYVGITQRPVNWVLDADIKGFFDALDHGWLMKFLEHRIADPRMLRLIQQWLHAGVSEDGIWSKTTTGTPQGAVISPLLANLFLHHVFDLWVKWWRTNRATGAVTVVRYADDFVVGFEHRAEAEAFVDDLRQRFAKFMLELHPEKTRLIEFGKLATANRARKGEGKPETFNFLGFTHICGKTKDGRRFLLLRRTMATRVHRIIEHVKDGLKRRWNESINEQGRWLKAVVQGVFNYYAVPTNGRRLNGLRQRISQIWLRRLRKKSQRAKMKWETMDKIKGAWLPAVRILHPYPDRRLVVIHPR